MAAVLDETQPSGMRAVKDISVILSAAASGDPRATQELFPLVYEELKALARKRVAQEKIGHSLNATALVHEAYMRLVGSDGGPSWQNRGHFFAAAAEAMRRILVESARRKSRVKHGGELHRVELTNVDVEMRAQPETVLAINDALEKFAQEDPLGAELVKLRYFAGLSVEEAGHALSLSRADAYRHWKYARAWLQCDLADAAVAETRE
jgi:RNA polymerase sigma factor (TIGR02999 family)